MRAVPTSTSMSNRIETSYKKLIGIGRGLAGQDLKNFSQILRQNRCTSGYQLVDESSGEVFQVPPSFEFLRRKKVLFHVGIVQNSIIFKKSPRY